MNPPSVAQIHVDAGTTRAYLESQNLVADSYQFRSRRGQRDPL